MSNKKFIMFCLLTFCLSIFITQNAMAGADWKEKQEQMFAKMPVKPGDVVDRSSWEKAKGLLPEQVLDMVKAGEASGALEVILQRLADFKERAQSLKRTVQGAMIYPVMVILVATGIVGFIMYWIIPRFAKIFDDFDTELPGITILFLSSQFFIR